MYYTVNDLREALANLDGSLPVILSADEEGNGFKHLYDISTNLKWDDDADYVSEEDDFGSACVVLWP